MNKKRILVAMSGGVDSSVVASKMIDDGHEVEGITLNFGKFCSKLAIIDARKVANQLGIKHHILDCEKNFENKVVKYFSNEYYNGNTPNPCVKCNREVKFFELLKFREQNGFDYLVTGHYAKISEKNNIYWLEKGTDTIKDQSYFLGQLKYEYLQYIKFPLENIEKTEVRNYAKKLNLIVADKVESQDICFTKGKNYKEIIKNYYNIEKGDILHINGKKLGEHEGIINYTQGQRKGLAIAWAEPLFVIKIDAEKNIVFVGNEKDLFKNHFEIDNLNFFDFNLKFAKEYQFDIKIRSTKITEKAKMIFNREGKTNIHLLKESRNISKGQLCCIYDNERIICSGFINQIFDNYNFTALDHQVFY